MCLPASCSSLPPTTTQASSGATFILLRSQFLQKIGFEFLEALCIGGGVKLIRPHNQSIFLVITIVAMAQAGLAKPIFAIEILSIIIGYTHFKRDPFGTDFIGNINQTGEHIFAQAASAKIWMHGDRRHMGLVDHEPEAGKADNRG